jgi:hypothetical protein
MQVRVDGSNELERNWFTKLPFCSILAPLKQSKTSFPRFLSIEPTLNPFFFSVERAFELQEMSVTSAAIAASLAALQ